MKKNSNLNRVLLPVSIRAALVFVLVIGGMFLFLINAAAQNNSVIVKDTIIYRITYRDTVIYKHDTVHIRNYILNDTIRSLNEDDRKKGREEVIQRKRFLNMNNWGIGPSAGAYYSPFNGFDINVGFGIQYYFLSVPSFRNPHLRSRRPRK